MSDLFPPIPPRTRLTHFSPDGCTVVMLPFKEGDNVTLLHQNGVDLVPYIFGEADASVLACALDQGATYEFKPDLVTLKRPDGRTVPITAIPRRAVQGQRSVGT